MHQPAISPASQGGTAGALLTAGGAPWVTQHNPEQAIALCLHQQVSRQQQFTYGISMPWMFVYALLSQIYDLRAAGQELHTVSAHKTVNRLVSL
jgi:hypothetical protein